jgi:hypothetical protein
MTDKQIPAFPVQSIYVEDQDTNSRGMTLRDYFAAKVLQGVMSSVEMGIIFSKGEKPPSDEIAESAYAMADAMLEARNGQN